MLPMMNPATICRYENPLCATDPGTDMNVTPDIAAPTIANAATNHGVRRPPVKNVALSPRRDVRHEIKNCTARYSATVTATVTGFMSGLSVLQPKLHKNSRKAKGCTARFALRGLKLYIRRVASQRPQHRKNVFFAV